MLEMNYIRNNAKINSTGENNKNYKRKRWKFSILAASDSKIISMMMKRQHKQHR